MMTQFFRISILIWLLLFGAQSMVAQYGMGGTSPTGTGASGGGGGGGGGEVTQGTTPWVGSLQVGGSDVDATHGLYVRPGTSSIFGVNIAQYLGSTASASNAVHVQPGTGALFTAQGTVANGAANSANPLNLFRDAGGLARYGLVDTSGRLGVASRCTQQTKIELTATGNTEIIPISASTVIRICHLSLAGDATANVKITRGTGTNCGTGTTDVTGAYRNAVGTFFDLGDNPVYGAAGGAICINLTAGNWGGLVIWDRE